MGYSGHKHQKGLKELTLADNNGFVIAPLVVRPVNQHDTLLLSESLDNLVDIAYWHNLDIQNSYLTLDTGFDSDYNDGLIRSLGMIPVIKPNRRALNEKQWQTRLYNFEPLENVYKERYKVERTFSWRSKYRKLVIRYEKLECTHNGFKYLAYSLVNLRVFLL
ncbi:transposase [Candidatus Falkowbacteria bacterium]|nr:transposase [Candidatus Falkowbacteria bacterium]